jgi:hypothetical protein
MNIKVIYGNAPAINKKVLEVDSKFKTILVTDNSMSIWQELVDELHQIIRGEVEGKRYAVYEMNSNKLMYVW